MALNDFLTNQLPSQNASGGAYGPTRPGATPVSYDPQTGMVLYSDGTTRHVQDGPAQPGIRSLGNFQGGSSLYGKNIAAPTTLAAAAQTTFGSEPTPGGGSGGTGAAQTTQATQAQFTPTDFNGTMYYDPASLADAQRQYIDHIYRGQLQGFDSALQRQTGATDRNAVDPSAYLNAGDKSIGGSFGDAKSSLLKQVSDLIDSYNKGETQAQGNLQSYYSNLGDAYQSSQGVRQDQTAQDYTKARTNANDQQTTGLTALQKSLQDYLQQDQSNRTNLSQNYTTALDTQQNASTNAYQTALGRNLTQGDFSFNPQGATGQNVNNNSGLIGALQKSASGTFRLQGQNGLPASEADILKYIYGS